jgi:hypothetical protein
LPLETTGAQKLKECAKQLWSLGFRGAGESDWMFWPLWLLWGALTDWHEAKPAERSEAEQAMVRAAEEFVAMASDDDGLHNYFDIWLYERLGLERPGGPSGP